MLNTIYVINYATEFYNGLTIIIPLHLQTTVRKLLSHYEDVMMCAMAFQITSLMVVYSTVYSDADQRKRQSSASLAFVWGIRRWSVNSPRKWPVTRKMFPFDIRYHGIPYKKYNVVWLTFDKEFCSPVEQFANDSHEWGKNVGKLPYLWLKLILHGTPYIFCMTYRATIVFCACHTSQQTHWNRGKMADIFFTTYSNAFSWREMFEFWSKYRWNVFLRFALTIC